MILNKIALRVVAKAIQEKQDLVNFNKSWQRVYEEYAIGLAQGTQLKLSAADRAELQALIKLEQGIDLGQTSIDELHAMPREQALNVAIDEKLAGKAVKYQRIAIKSLAKLPLKLNQQAYQLPASGHIDISLEQIESVEHRCILMIENYRCFDQLQRIKLELPEQYKQPLVLYRGDDYYSQKTVKLFLQQVNLPVITMMDIDPAGLVMASSYANTIGMMCIDLVELERLVKAKGNADLYAKQLPVYQQALNKSTEPVITALWAILKKHQKGWVQEHYLNLKAELSLFAFTSIKN
ncbi:MAG: hypothetical protein GQ582_11680 [Methyloprofundus sp.]|nr:hypothetical protein [Methyloprofundus sp.]